MKTGLITAAAIASVLVLSGTAVAAGDNCPSKSGAHKDMSAAITKDGVDHHGWVASQDAVTAEQGQSVIVPGTEAKQEAPVLAPQGALKI